MLKIQDFGSETRILSWRSGQGVAENKKVPWELWERHRNIIERFSTQELLYKYFLLWVFRSMMFRNRSQTFHGAFSFAAHALCPLFQPSIELSEPKSWIFNVNFSDLVLQSNVQANGWEHGYQHCFVVFYCVLNTLPSVVAVSTLQKKILHI